MQKKKNRKWGWIILGSLLAVLILIIAGGFVFSLLQKPPSTPLVTIQKPENDTKVIAGGLVSVHSTARDEQNNITKVQLWEVVDDRLRLISEDVPIEPGHVFSLPQGWQPLATGDFQLMVRAFNDQDDYGQASINIEVVSEAEGANVSADSEALAIGEILPGLGFYYPQGSIDEIADESQDEESQTTPAYEVSFEGTQVTSPEQPIHESTQESTPEQTLPEGTQETTPEGQTPEGTQETTPEGQTPEGPSPSPTEPTQELPTPDPDPAQPPDGFDIDLTGLVIQGLGDIFTPEAYSRWLNLEVISFEVTKYYNGVYCYATLASSPWGRIPETGLLDTTDQYHWNLEDYLGGENTVELQVMKDGPLDMRLSCYGYRENTLYTVGSLNVSHPPEDWNGQLIEASSQSGEGFEVSYRINPVGGEFDTPILLEETQWGQKKYFHWVWEGDPAAIDGFRIYQKDNLVANVVPETRVYELPLWWTTPPCNEEYDYYIVGYKGGLESPPSNHLRYQGGVCDGETDIIYAAGMPNCGGTGQRFIVKYLYAGESPAGIGIRVFKDGQRVENIYSTHTQIAHSEGKVQIGVTYHGQEPITTDQLMVYMYNENNQYIYVKNFDRVIEWAPGTSDLVIRQAWVDRENQTLKVGIYNEGCACPPAENPDVQIIREADGWRGFESVQGKIFARSGKLVEISLNLDEMHLWGGRITLKVDPHNTTQESNEDNNGYTIGAARIKAVQIYKVIIYNDHEGRSGNPGEFMLYFSLSKENAPFEERDFILRYYQWHEGDHAIHDWFYYPVISENDTLELLGRIWERDDLPIRGAFLGSIDVLHGPDATQADSWKGGGEFSVLSTKEEYLLFYRIILE